MSVQALLGPLKPFLAFDKHRITNAVFSLHCKFTVLILICGSLLVSASQFLGDPIDCVVHGVAPSVMDTYCWIHSTFILPGKITNSSDESAVAHPGVGVDTTEEDKVYLAYYQWVAFMLVFQAMLFYVPRFIWVSFEGKKIQKLVPEEFIYNVSDSRMPTFSKPIGLLKEQIAKNRCEIIANTFLRHTKLYNGKVYSMYYLRFIFCEVLNFVNVVLQMFFVDKFLGGMFTKYGIHVLSVSNLDPDERYDPMNVVFPKVTKCTFEKFGSSGTVQRFDGLCVLPINIINEKSYIFYWFWFYTLAVITAFALVYRACSVISKAVRKLQLRGKTNLYVNPLVVDTITDHLNAGDCFFLGQLGSNLDPFVFSHLLNVIDGKIREVKKLPPLENAKPNGSVEKMA